MKYQLLTLLFLTSLLTFGQKSTVTGVIKDNSQQTIPGVNVLYKKHKLRYAI